MHALPVDAGRVVGERVQPNFLLAPVKACLPVGDQALEIGEVGAVLPRLAVRRFVGPTRTGESSLEIVEQGVVAPGPRSETDTVACTPWYAGTTRTASPSGE